MMPDAIVNIRFATSVITQGGAEVIAYGTAVRDLQDGVEIWQKKTNLHF